MRILLFHGGIDALNHFTDNASAFLREIGCETFICTLPLTKREEDRLNNFLSGGVHAVIMYDGIGMVFRKLYDQLEIPVVNILVDHPMTFWHCMETTPQKYIQFSPDENHVTYSKKYWNIENSFFLPHVGTAPVFNGGERPISLLFSGYYESRDDLLKEVCSKPESKMRNIFLNMIDYMLMDSAMTIEEACRIVLYDQEPSELAFILTQAKSVDMYIRMCYRDRVLRTILEHGIDITVIGEGWDKSDLFSYTNFHWFSRIPFEETFQYMRKSKLVLNVMPWFKAGTHERIFNTLLSGACPVSDKSKWLEEKFKDKEDIAFYDLDNLEALPELIEELLQNDNLREEIIRNGREKVIHHYTTENVIGEALQKIIDLYYT